MEAATKKYACLFFIPLLMICCSSNFAAEPTLPQAIGQVVWVKNNLKAQQPNAEIRTLTRRSAIYEHDTLTTDATSSGEISFTDDSALALREDSTIKIDQYRHATGKAASSDAFVVNVLKGGFRTVTGIISKNDPGGYKATTAVATIGIRGTIYSIYYNPIKKSLAAKIDKGSIFISNQNGAVTLTKCEGNLNTRSACINTRYAEVKGENAAPAVVSEQPIVFKNEPSLTMNGLPKGKSSGLVGSFCIQ